MDSVSEAVSQFEKSIQTLVEESETFSRLFLNLLEAANRAHGKLYMEFHRSGDAPDEDEWAEGSALRDALYDAWAYLGWPLQGDAKERRFSAVPFSEIPSERGWWHDVSSSELHAVAKEAIQTAREEECDPPRRGKRKHKLDLYRAGDEAIREMLFRLIGSE